MRKRLLFIVTVLSMSLLMLASSVVGATSKKSDSKGAVLTLSKTELCLYVGQVRKLDYNLSGNTNNKKTRANLVWKSSDKKIVTVNKNGKIKGKKSGKAKITVWIKGNSNTKISCKVRVKKFKKMNYSVPFDEVKYIDRPIELTNIKGDLTNNYQSSNYSEVIESRKELNYFLNKYNLKEKLNAKGYSFDNIEYSENNILIYTMDVRFAGQTVRKPSLI